ncbi:MAG: HPr family phosphocarrier protein [Planctomycetota bacterium]
MSDQYRSTVVTINNPQGLHMRPAYLFAETAAKFSCHVELVKDGNRVDGKSVIDILTLGASQGTQVTVEAKGDDAESAIHTLEGLLASGFPAKTGDPPAQ